MKPGSFVIIFPVGEIGQRAGGTAFSALLDFYVAPFDILFQLSNGYNANLNNFSVGFECFANGDPLGRFKILARTGRRKNPTAFGGYTFYDSISGGYFFCCALSGLRVSEGAGSDYCQGEKNLHRFPRISDWRELHRVP